MIHDFSFLAGLFIAFLGFMFARTLYIRDVKRFGAKNINCTETGVGIVIQSEHKTEREFYAGEPSRLVDYWRYELDILDINGVRRRVKTDWNCWHLGRPGTRFDLRYNPNNMAEFAVRRDGFFGVLSIIMCGLFAAGGVFGLWMAWQLFMFNFR